MTVYLAVPLLVIIALLQATVMPRLAIGGVFADLPILAVVTWSLVEGPHAGIAWAFIAGVVLDALSGAPFGAVTLPLIVVGALSGLARGSVLPPRFVLPLVATFLATIIYDLLFLFLVLVSGRTVSWLNSLYRIILPTAALNAALMLLIFPLARALHNRFSRDEMEW